MPSKSGQCVFAVMTYSDQEHLKTSGGSVPTWAGGTFAEPSRWSSDGFLRIVWSKKIMVHGLPHLFLSIL